MTVKKLSLENKGILYHLFILSVCFAGGMLLSSTVIFSLAPMGIALICAVPLYAVLPTAIGSAVGSVMIIGQASVTKYLLSAFFASSIRLIFSALKPESRASQLISSFISITLSGFIVLVFGKFNYTLFILSVFESAFCLALCYFFTTAISVLSKTQSAKCMDFKQITAVLVFISAILSSLSFITVFDISIARILSAALILSASFFGKEQSGAIAGTAFGASLALFNPDLLFLCGGYSMGGLFSGVFSRAGQTAGAIVFALINGLFALISGQKELAIIVCYEVLFASVLFLILPSGIKKQISAFFTPKTERYDLSHPQRLISTRLSRASFALNEMSKTVTRVSDILNDFEDDFEGVFERVRVSACRGCALNNYCWESQKAETLSKMIMATKLIRSGENEIFDEEFIQRCTRKATVERGLSAAFYDYINKENTRRHIKDVQSAVRLQFDSVSALLNQFSNELCETENFDGEEADRIESALKGMNLHPLSVSCFIDKNKRLRAEITLSDKVIPQKKIAERLSLVCERGLETREVERSDKSTFLCLCERAVYSVDFAARQYTNKGYSVCGDAYNKLCSSLGQFCMLISDGMGSGTHAAVEGTMTVGLMSRLIKSGFDCKSAIGLVNSALIFKGAEESLATLDISCIDLYTGKAKFFKAGTPPTFIRRNGLMGTAVCSALPIGILPHTQLEESECNLQRGDIIVMVSDGATDNGQDWIKGEIKTFSGTADELAERLIKTAVSRFCSHQDDITVLVAIIK